MSLWLRELASVALLSMLSPTHNLLQHLDPLVSIKILGHHLQKLHMDLLEYQTSKRNI